MLPFLRDCAVMWADFLPGNTLRLLNSGNEYFPALLAAIAEAEQEIWLESYIFVQDDVGEAVAAALIAAARRGVLVRVLVDGFGSRNFRTDFAARFQAAGVMAMEYRPEFGGGLKRHRLRRLHRKLVLVDRRVAFVGGINIVDDNNARPGLAPRFDYAVSVEGPVITQIYRALAHMWEIVSWVNLKRRYRLQQPVLPAPSPAGTQQAALLIRDNIRHRNDIANAYLRAIYSSRQEILIACAYFLPGFRFRHALRSAARRGVQIRLLLQGPSDHPLLRYATQALYGSLLKDGIRIFEYRKSFLHAKVAVVDQHWATVGSSNIDPFSLLLAKESNLVALDRGFAAELQRSLENAMEEGAVELKPGDLKRFGLLARGLRWLSYGAVRLMVGLAGYGGRHWGEEPQPRKRTAASGR